MELNELLLFAVKWIVIMAIIGGVSYAGTWIYRKWVNHNKKRRR